MHALKGTGIATGALRPRSAVAALLLAAGLAVGLATPASAIGWRLAGDRVAPAPPPTALPTRLPAPKPQPTREARPDIDQSGEIADKLRLARRYEHGEGVEQDLAEARRLYCEAAFEGGALAAYSLGWMYLNGRGVERDDDKAATWFRIAAERGSEPSRNLLKTLPDADRDAERDCPQDHWLLASKQELERRAPEEVKALAERWAAEAELDPYLVLAVIAVESEFKEQAVSHKSAMGLMQLIPETAARFGVKNAFDPSENVRGGTRYLRWLLDHFDGDLKLALAGYNSGENKVAAYGGVPPYPETQGYIEKIRGLYAHPLLDPKAEGAAEARDQGESAAPAPDSTTRALVRLTLAKSDFLSSGWHR